MFDILFADIGTFQCDDRNVDNVAYNNVIWRKLGFESKKTISNFTAIYDLSYHEELK